MTAPKQLMARLCVEARSHGFEVEENPTALTYEKMRARAVSASFVAGPPDIERPPVILGFFARSIPTAEEMSSQYAVMIGSLDGVEKSDKAIAELWSRYHGQAAITRSWLIDDNLDDLCLILVGPEGSENDPFWIAQSSEIERNDLVCRKLIWLPPPTDDGAESLTRSLDNLVARTFLARPWEVGADDIQNSLDSLTSEPVAWLDLGIPPETLRAWFTLLETAAKEGTDADDLVARLIDTIE